MSQSLLASRMTKSEWSLLTLLVVSVFINYIDRSNLSMAAPLLEKELALSPLQVGSLLAAFFWTYAVIQLIGLAGWLTDRFPVRIVFACGFLTWSLATVATGFLSGFPAIYGARLLLGAGESVAYPCYSKIFATDLPQHHRGRANALLDAGTKLGPALGTFLGGVLLIRLGWRMFFILLGAGSLIWLIPWLKRMPSSLVDRPKPVEDVSSVLELLTVRSAWGAFLGHFCGNYLFYFLLTWLPIYLVKERGFSIFEMGNFVSILFLVVAAATVLAGWISDRLIASGSSITTVRKTIVVLGLVCASAIVTVPLVTRASTAMVFLTFSCIGYGTYASNHWAITQTLAGPTMAGRWTSLQNGIGNMSGVVGPWLAGLIVETSGSSRFAFAISAAMAIVGAIMWGLVVGPVKQVNWSGEPKTAGHRETSHI